MRITTGAYLTQVNRSNRVRNRFRKLQKYLSLLVILCVFWGLKLTGITMAGEAFCGMEEHTHGDSCRTQTLICEQEETFLHEHTDACMSSVLQCTLPEQEGHIHTETCLETVTVQNCEIPESEPHVHSETCYEVLPACGLPESEEHQHADLCMAETLICTVSETEGHIHTEDCFTENTQYICGQEEAEAHFHTDTCYIQQVSCGLEEIQTHVHSETCYVYSDDCQLTEHIHTENCYSDNSADLETCDEWEMSLAEIVRSESVAENMVMVAQSQLDVAESLRNFQVDETGVRRGITRYGQWYGNPYGKWSAMFASFCLEYSGAMEVPLNAGPETMRLAWEEAGLYLPTGETEPMPGDLLFLDKDEDGSADAVAVVTDLKEGVIFVIEGDLAEAVTEIGTVSLFEDEPETEEVSAEELPQEETTPSEPAETVAETAPSEPAETVVETVPSEPAQTEPAQLIQETEISEEPVQDKVLQTLYAMEDPRVLGYGALPVDPTFAPLRAGDTCYIWLDGTNGGMDALRGSENKRVQVQEGQVYTLPETHTSPSKYSYRLRGWYEVTRGIYYAPGEQVTIPVRTNNSGNSNLVFYADWVAETYDIGQFNAQVSNTVSTNTFVTTHLFDYNYLFNVQSSNASVSFSNNNNSHTETWSMVESDTVKYGNKNSINFIFGDNDGGGRLSNPNNRTYDNKYHDATTVSDGIYNATLGELVFGTDNGFDPETKTGIIGKTYLGTGDHLFQIMDNPDDEHYGYYYYDSKHNAASYNQKDQRFYVYDYLAATSDSIGGAYSDFIPLNSPYANTNGKTVGRYTYDGVDGEYRGVSHYRYDSKYDSGDHNSANNVATDYAYGMRSDVSFYMPNNPGTGGNKDLNGNDMQFHFSGDDDLWVLIDGKMALDIGGIHQIVAGSINFSTGEILVNGKQQASLMDLGITSGDHTLTILYLERGSSMSNCAIYFNLAPRFGLQLRKEDVLTQAPLDGAQFTVYEDLECNQPAELWDSEAAYLQDAADGKLDQFRSTFTVSDGIAGLWGLGSGNTYYIKETKAPDAEGYGISYGIIRLTIEKDGLATYKVDVVPDTTVNPPPKHNPSIGFTVHGVNIDEKTQTVYIVVTNAQMDEKQTTTTVQVIKKWEDSKDHSGDYIEAYLTVTDPDGTIRRIRSVTLSDENEWQYIWTNLPNYYYGTQTAIQYGVEESYENGYYSTVRQITSLEITTTKWMEAMEFVTGESYILKSEYGYLSTTSSSPDANLKWVDEETAKTSPLALWTAVANSEEQVRLTNGANQVLSYNNGSSNNSRYFYATSDNASNQTLTATDAGSGFRFSVTINNWWYTTTYYMSSSGINSSGRIPTATSENSGLILTPMEESTDHESYNILNWGYLITNTPLEVGNETSLTVHKAWDYGYLEDSNLHEQAQVTVKLLANGKDTGRTVTLSLKNSWQGTFRGLPYVDTEGNVITYTVLETWDNPDWFPSYGPVNSTNGSPPTYSTTVTNNYRAGTGGPMLPSTGTAARMLYVLCGGGIMLSSLVYGIILRRRRERRRRRAF